MYNNAKLYITLYAFNTIYTYITFYMYNKFYLHTVFNVYYIPSEIFCQSQKSLNLQNSQVRYSESYLTIFILVVYCK